MKCAYHPSLDAVATCSSCGRAICSGCVVDTGERVICQNCLAARSRPSAVYGPRNNQMAIWSMALGLGGWGVICLSFLLNLVVGILTFGIGSICLIPLGLVPLVAWIVGVILGHRGINELNMPGNEEGGRGMAITGLIAGYVGLGLSLLSCVIFGIMLAIGMSIPFLDAMSY